MKQTIYIQTKEGIKALTADVDTNYTARVQYDDRCEIYKWDQHSRSLESAIDKATSTKRYMLRYCRGRLRRQGISQEERKGLR